MKTAPKRKSTSLPALDSSPILNTKRARPQHDFYANMDEVFDPANIPDTSIQNDSFNSVIEECMY